MDEMRLICFGILITTDVVPMIWDVVAGRYILYRVLW